MKQLDWMVRKLFHVPTQELPRVIEELSSCLKSNGVLFSSNPSLR